MLKLNRMENAILVSKAFSACRESSRVCCTTMGSSDSIRLEYGRVARNFCRIRNRSVSEMKLDSRPVQRLMSFCDAKNAVAPTKPQQA
jgi:hypothetical protein